MKKFFCAALIFTTIFLFSCGDEPEKDGGTAVLFSSLAEIWLEAGGSVDITVGETIERGFAPKGTPIVDNGAGKTVNTELLISMRPSLVICSLDIPAQAEIVPVLKKAGVKVLCLKVESFDDYIDALDKMTSLTGKREAYEKALRGIAKEVKEITEKASAIEKKVLFIRAGSTAASTKAKTGKDHFAAAMLSELGCINIAEDSVISGAELNMEAVLLADPDFIFFSLMGNEEAAIKNINSFLDSDIWQELRAVKEGRTYILPRELFHFKPCSRWAEAYGYLANILCEEE